MNLFDDGDGTVAITEPVEQRAKLSSKSNPPDVNDLIIAGQTIEDLENASEPVNRLYVPLPPPPHDLEAERAVLSALLLESGAFENVPELRPEHFYSNANSRIFQAILDLKRAGRAVDLVTLKGYLQDNNRLAQVGGAAYLAQIVDATPSIANVAAHAQLVLKKWQARGQRRLISGLKVDSAPETIRATLEAVLALTTPIKTLRARTISDIVGDWRNEGKVVRIPTGIKALDIACGGGLPLPRRVLIIGAPSAGKTFTEIVLADTFASRFAAMGFCVGVMAVDESDLDIGSRIAQMHGFSRDEIESRNPEILDSIERMLESSKIRFYDADWTIENVVADLKSWAKPDNSPMVLCVDSLHTVRSVGSDLARTRKEFVDANCAALKRANIDDRITIIATGEMARGQYANENFAQDAVAIAACADSRAPEFMAEILLKLTTPKGLSDMICVDVPKNRGGQRDVKFWLRLNFNQHTFTEAGDPNQDPVVIEQRETQKRQKEDQKQTSFAGKLAWFILKNPHLPKSRLIALAKAEFHCGYTAIENGLTVLSTSKTRYRLVESKEGTGKTSTTFLDIESFESNPDDN